MIEAWWQVSPKPWDEAEFERLYLAHYEGLARLLVRLLGSAEEAAELLIKSFSASVAFSSRAVAIPTPIPKGCCDLSQLVVAGCDAPSLTHGDMVCRVE